MVHGSLTRSKRYSLFLANRKWEKVSTALWQGKGLLVSSALTGRERVWLFRYCCSTSTISQSSATSGSLATGTGGVVGLAAGGVDGGVKVGIPGTLVSPGRGNGTGFTDAGGRSLPSR